MKVLHVYRTYFPDPPGGLQEAIRQISLSTSSLGASNRVFALSPAPTPRELQRPEAKVVRECSLGAPASCDIGGIGAFRCYSELTEWADIVHFHFPWPFADLLNWACPTKKAKIMTYHSDIVRQRALGALYSPLMRRTLRDMDAVVATSPAYAMSSPALRCLLPERLRVIPLGINDQPAGELGSDRADARLRAWGIGDRPYVLALGVLRYYKGLHSLVEAAVAVCGTVVIAGSGPEGQRLQSLAASLGVTNVVFVGQVSEEEKAILLRRCRALVLPSHLRSEAFGMVLVEASMHGKPMVCCEIGSGTSFVNCHGETGLVVPPETPHELTGAINALLSDEAMAETMGRAARMRYERMFSGPALGQAYFDLYSEVA